MATGGEVGAGADVRDGTGVSVAEAVCVAVGVSVSTTSGVSVGGASVLVGTAVLVVVYGISVYLYQIYVGMGVAGFSHPVFWGVYIVTFVFWVGIAHAGTLISAILYLFRSK